MALPEEEIRPFQVLYTDFTELVYRNGEAKAWLIPFLGHRTKKVFGWAAGDHRAPRKLHPCRFLGYSESLTADRMSIALIRLGPIGHREGRLVPWRDRNPALGE